MLAMRWLFAVMALIAVATSFNLRLNLSVVMTTIARANDEASKQSRGNSSSSNHMTCARASHNASIMGYDDDDDKDDYYNELQVPEFEWSSHTQELLLAAYFIGYTPAQVVAGWTVDRFGGKWLVAGGLCLSAIMNLLAPLAVRTAVPLFFATRVVSGMGEAFHFPGINTLMSKWCPAKEQTRMMAFIISGLGLGSAFGQIISGLLCAYVGWETTFYLFGSLALVWVLLWSGLVYEEPQYHPFISEKERKMIEVERTRGSNTNTKTKTPFLAMMTSLPSIAWFSSMVTVNGFVIFILMSNLPLYMKHVQGLDVAQIGYLVAIPYIVHLTSIILTSNLSDALMKRNILTRSQLRKAVIDIGSIVCAGSLLGVAHSGCNPYTSVALMTTAMVGIGMADAGIFINPIDLAPRFAGTLVGIGNAMSTSTGFIGPLIVGSFTEDQDDPRGWSKVFYFTAAMSLLGAIVFHIFGSGDEQEWAKIVEVDDDVKNVESDLGKVATQGTRTGSDSSPGPATFTMEISVISSNS